MPVREILTVPDPRLKMKAQPVDNVADVQPLIDDLLDTMYSEPNGVGLAAPQIGESVAIVVIDVSPTRDEPLVLINPKVEWGDNKEFGQEGCLSIPEYYEDVERYTHVVVSALDRDGNDIKVESDEFLAIVMQHEIDHLHGIVFTDYLSPLKRQRALKKVKKAVKQKQRNVA